MLVTLRYLLIGAHLITTDMYYWVFGRVGVGLLSRNKEVEPPEKGKYDYSSKPATDVTKGNIVGYEGNRVGGD